MASRSEERWLPRRDLIEHRQDFAAINRAGPLRTVGNMGGGNGMGGAGGMNKTSKL